jgi:molybdopterin converting factor small subunit
MKTVQVQFYALLREQARCSGQAVTTAAPTPAELYAELRVLHGFSLPRDMLRVAVNDAFCEWSQPLADGDRVVFIPPVAGG